MIAAQPGPQEQKGGGWAGECPALFLPKDAEGRRAGNDHDEQAPADYRGGQALVQRLVAAEIDQPTARDAHEVSAKQNPAPVGSVKRVCLAADLKPIEPALPTDQRQRGGGESQN